ncbi:MAG: phosphoribosylanthranilate isomerase [Dehalococcoidia bacterium]
MPIRTVRTRIKLCGLNWAAYAALAQELDVDFIGLMFAEHSRRHVTVEEAKQIAAVLGPRQRSVRPLVHDGIPAGGWFERCAAGFDELLSATRPLVVGVFVDQPPSLVNAIAELVPLDVVQFSGQEPWEQALEIRRPTIKAIHVEAAMDARAVLDRCEVGTAAVCMLDTGGTGAAGGTGVAFDWDIAAAVAAQTPIVLAGGLHAGNVGEAIRRVRPWGVDVSSGIETDGSKDETKMRAFVAAVRAADAVLSGEE